jgi:hypothetical protein
MNPRQIQNWGGSLCLLTLGLAACGPMLPSSLWALRDVDMATTNAEALRVRVDVPGVALPKPDGVQLVATLEAEGDQKADEFAFTLVRDTAELSDDPAVQGVRDLTYRIAPEDLAIFDSFRTAMETERSGSLSVDTELCRLSEDIPARLLVSVALKTEELEDFVLLFRDQDMLEDVSPEDAEAALPKCKGL